MTRAAKIILLYAKVDQVNSAKHNMVPIGIDNPFAVHAQPKCGIATTIVIATVSKTIIQIQRQHQGAKIAVPCIRAKCLPRCRIIDKIIGIFVSRPLCFPSLMFPFLMFPLCFLYLTSWISNGGGLHPGPRSELSTASNGPICYRRHY